MRSEQKIVLKLVATLSLSMSTPDKCNVDKVSFLVLIKFSAKFAFLTIQTGKKHKKARVDKFYFAKCPAVSFLSRLPSA